MLDHYRIHWSNSLNCWVIQNGIMQALSTDTEFRIPSSGEAPWIFYVDAELSSEMTPIFHLRSVHHPSVYMDERQMDRVHKLVTLFGSDISVDGRFVYVEFPE